MSNGFWDDNETFRDMPEVDGNGQPLNSYPTSVTSAKSLNGNASQAPQQQEAFIVEDYAEPRESSQSSFESDEEEDYSSVLSDARLRLEQGRLYEMIMNHDLFNGLDADEKAVKSVQKQIRKFAKEQMEVMLGMRQNIVSAPGLVSSPFNDLEVEVLKRLASTATKGATETEEANTYVRQEPKKTTLNAISSSSKKKVMAPIEKKEANKLPSAKPMERLNKQLIAVGLPEEVEKPLEKPLGQMSFDELRARNARIEERQKQNKAVAKNVIPQMTYEQQSAMYAQRAAQIGPGMANLINLVSNAKK